MADRLDEIRGRLDRLDRIGRPGLPPFQVLTTDLHWLVDEVMQLRAEVMQLRAELADAAQTERDRIVEGTSTASACMGRADAR